jgi:hypothetical protein
MKAVAVAELGAVQQRQQQVMVVVRRVVVDVMLLAFVDGPRKGRRLRHFEQS